MRKKKAKAMVLACALVIGGVVYADSVEAYGPPGSERLNTNGDNMSLGGQWMGNKKHMMSRRNIKPEVKEAIIEGDYEKFLETSEGKKEISEDEFEILVDIHEYMEDGEYEKARVIAKENGLRLPIRGHRIEVWEAIDEGDYNEFVRLTGREISEDDFEIIVEIHELKEEGEFGGVRKLWKELKGL